MKPSNIMKAILACIEIKKPVFIWGEPGIGKSDTVRAAAKELGVELVDFRAALRDAVDIMGLPYTEPHGKTQRATAYALPAGLPRAGEGILFLDEMNSAPPQTQAALYQLVLDRRVGDYVLPPGWHIIAAGNRMSDRGVVHRMPDPLVDRFFHIDYEVNLTDWCDWAAGHGVKMEVISFIRFREELLLKHDTGRKCHAFSTPRGWADVSRVMDVGGNILGDLVRGRVGDGAASEFMTYLKMYREMVSPDEILKNPKTAEVPKNIGVLYALSEALARRAVDKNLGAVLTYAKRMPSEYAQSLVSSAIRYNPALANTHEYIKYCAKEVK